MGNCVGGERKPKDHHQENGGRLQKLMNEKEFMLLHLIYTDLASRISENELNLQNFLLFFHKNGYWGDQLFREFDANESNLISEEQFIKGIIKTFKTTHDQKIELLFKFFSNDNMEEGITFTSFLTMLYNYPKEDFKQILNDPEFVDEALKKYLVGVENELQNRRLMSVCPSGMMDKKFAGATFRLKESQTSSRLQSRAGNRILNEVNQIKENQTCLVKLTIGDNDIEVKTTSIHHLVKKFAKNIFKKYDINIKTGRLKMDKFKIWIQRHPKLFLDYYSGFHSEAWEVDSEKKPLYLSKQLEFKSKAKFFIDSQKSKKVLVYLLNSILLFIDQDKLQTPILIICLEGLAVKTIFQEANGCGIEITHRDGLYTPHKFFVLNKQIQKQWMQNLKYFQGSSITQLYDMGEKIGVGKFSVVYRCKQKQKQQEYAIKVIETFKLDDQAKRLIAHESSIMTILSHPLLVFFKESIQTKTHIYIITELVKGKDMFEFVKDLKFLEEYEAAYIIQQIIIGVRYIHSLGIVHRDLKPENIMIEYDEEEGKLGKIKIIDFGFANYLSKLKDLPAQELFAGTPNYIAPQILRGEQISEKIDNFAVGSIMYFALSGTLPFNSIDISAILTKTMEGGFTINGPKWKDISADAKDLIQKLLEGDPLSRLSLSDALKHKWFKILGEQNTNNCIIRKRGTKKVTQKNKVF